MLLPLVPAAVRPSTKVRPGDRQGGGKETGLKRRVLGGTSEQGVLHVYIYTPSLLRKHGRENDGQTGIPSLTPTHLSK